MSFERSPSDLGHPVRWPGVLPPLQPRRTLSRTAWGVGGFGVFGLLWAGLARVQAGLPGPITALEAFGRTLRDHTGPALLPLLAQSLQRASLEFLGGVLIALPLGLLMGTVRQLRQALSLLTQLLRPISPVAWFPVALALLHVADAVSVFIVAVSALWPTLLGTARATGHAPRPLRNVARVYHFSPRRYLTRVVPCALHQMLAGLRSSFGAAWSVVIAAEVMSGAPMNNATALIHAARIHAAPSLPASSPCRPGAGVGPARRTPSVRGKVMTSGARFAPGPCGARRPTRGG